MVTIRNASPAGRGLPGGPTIPSGQAITLPGDDWTVMACHPVIASWIAAGDLVITDDVVSETSAEPGDASPGPGDNPETDAVNPDGAYVSPASAKAKKG